MFLSVAKGFHLARESESRPTTHLEQLLQDHPLWKRTKALLDKGCTIFYKQSTQITTSQTPTTTLTGIPTVPPKQSLDHSECQIKRQIPKSGHANAPPSPLQQK